MSNEHQSTEANDFVRHAMHSLQRSLKRLETAEDQIDQRTAEILSYHAVLERQLDALIQLLVIRPEKIRKLNFKQKGQLVAALWTGDTELVDYICEMASSFDDLRNAAAHNDRKEIEGVMVRLKSQAGPDRAESIREAAAVIVGCFGAMLDGVGPLKRL